MFNKTETENLSQKVAQDLLDTYIPIIVFLVLLVLIGIPGNVTAAAYFGRKKEKTSNDTFIMFLACVDLFVCGFIVVYIHELSVNILFSTTRFLCKAAYFVFHWGIFLSVSIVCAIAVGRFIKVCRPNGKQFKCTTARNISLGLVGVSAVVSSRDFLTYDSFTVNITISGVTVEVPMCMNVRSEDLQWAVIVSHVIDILFLVVSVVILVYSYGRIMYKLYELRNVMKIYENNPLNLQENQNTTPGSPSQGSQMISKSVPAQVENPDAHSNHGITSKERIVTWMMLTASATLIVCSMPYFIAILIDFREKSTEHGLSFGFRFAISSVLAINVSNPIIYCIFTQEYRRYLKNLFTRCICRNTRGIDSSTESPSE